MLADGLVKLSETMALRPFCQQVDYLATAFGNPVDGKVVVNESEHLYALCHPVLLGIAANHLHGFLLAFRDSGRGHLNAVNIQVAQQHAGYDQLFVRQETYA